MNAQTHVTSNLEQAWLKCRADLLNAMGEGGVWHGHLSDSALATAVAVFALHKLNPDANSEAVKQGLVWLQANINEDGGWGDTPESMSNLSTTLLCWAAQNIAARHDVYNAEIEKRASAWIKTEVGTIEPDAITDAVLGYYGQDRTFSAPILMMCALAGRLGPEPEAWERVPQLPFELGMFPQQFYRWLRLPVVSYAIPALVAVGLVRHVKKRTRFCPVSMIRSGISSRAVDRVARMQPDSGGFLEATPLTGFVAMGLAASGYGNHRVCRNAEQFLTESQRRNGAWPIDTNLATWVTTLSVKALVAGRSHSDALSPEQLATIRNWLLSQQKIQRHVYSGAEPGGWAWTDLSGGVPDVDDTSGALIALRLLCSSSDADLPEIKNAAARGGEWLLNLQNRDGGFPTFCRGWGRLPFDRSSPDLTAHAIQAIRIWAEKTVSRDRAGKSIAAALDYLKQSRNPDGSWTPLWFGNEQADSAENRTYGTAQVVKSLVPWEHQERGSELIQSGTAWLMSAQNPDGGWGGMPGVQSSIEETALAVSALSKVMPAKSEVIDRGVKYLVDAVNNDRLDPAPIGLYFAKLWYSEKLYPLIFTVEALGSFKHCRRCALL